MKRFEEHVVKMLGMSGLPPPPNPQPPPASSTAVTGGSAAQTQNTEGDDETTKTQTGAHKEGDGGETS